MKFARSVFIVAGAWGMIALPPLYWLVDITGRPYPAPTEQPHFFYGFVSVALAWQVAFMVIGSDPARYRALMIPGILEKAGYVIGTTMLYLQRRISASDAATAVPDAILAALFVASFLKTRGQVDATTRGALR